MSMFFHLFSHSVAWNPYYLGIHIFCHFYLSSIIGAAAIDWRIQQSFWHFIKYCSINIRVICALTRPPPTHYLTKPLTPGWTGNHSTPAAVVGYRAVGGGRSCSNVLRCVSGQRSVVYPGATLIHYRATAAFGQLR